MQGCGVAVRVGVGFGVPALLIALLATAGVHRLQELEARAGLLLKREAQASAAGERLQRSLVDALQEAALPAEDEQEVETDREPATAAVAQAREAAGQSAAACRANRLQLGELATGLEETRSALALGGGIALLALALAGALVGRGLARPLRRSLRALQELAQEEGLAGRLPEEGPAQLAELNRGLNKLLDRLKGRAGELAGDARRLGASAAELDAAARGTADAARESLRVTAAAGAAGDELAASCELLARSCLRAAEHSRRADAGAAQDSRAWAERAAGLKAGGARLRLAAAAWTELSADADDLAAVLSTVEALAEGSNRLAVEASVEATRAGVHGRGFSLVAEGMRALAERATRANAEVARRVRALQKRSAEALKALQAGEAELARGCEAAGTSGETLQAAREELSGLTALLAETAAGAHAQAAGEMLERELREPAERTEKAARQAEATGTAGAALSRSAMALQLSADRLACAPVSAGFPPCGTSGACAAHSAAGTPVPCAR